MTTTPRFPRRCHCHGNLKLTPEGHRRLDDGAVSEGGVLPPLTLGESEKAAEAKVWQTTRALVFFILALVSKPRVSYCLLEGPPGCVVCQPPRANKVQLLTTSHRQDFSTLTYSPPPPLPPSHTHAGAHTTCTYISIILVLPPSLHPSLCIEKTLLFIA